MITPAKFLNLIKEDDKDIFKLGYIASDDSIGQAKIRFDGEEVASDKSYLTVNYEPILNDRVLLVYVKGTYLVLGNVGQGLQLRSEVTANREGIEGINEAIEISNKQIETTSEKASESEAILNTLLGVD